MAVPCSSMMDREIIELFREILQGDEELGFVGREMFAVDGCNLLSNENGQKLFRQESHER